MPVGPKLVQDMLDVFADVMSAKTVAPKKKFAPAGQIGDVPFFQTGSQFTTKKLFSPKSTAAPTSPTSAGLKLPMAKSPTAAKQIPIFVPPPGGEQFVKDLPKAGSVGGHSQPTSKQIADYTAAYEGKPPAKKIPISTPAKPAPDDLTAEGFKQVGPQAGSNVGALYEDPQKQKWYVKNLKNEALGKNERLGNALYRLAGADVPEIGGKGAQVRSKIVEGDRIRPDNFEQARKLMQKDFAADAWLANWDVTGLGNDNFIYDPKAKKVYRIDTGGVLDYRAQGAAKTHAGLRFTSDADEVDTLRDPAVNPNSAKVFQGMTPQQLKESAQRLANITPEQVAEIVKQHGPADPVAQSNLTKLLLRRRDNVLQRLDPQETPGLTEAGKPGRVKALGDTMETFHGLAGPIHGAGLDLTSEGGFWTTPSEKLAGKYAHSSGKTPYDPATKKGDLASFITRTNDYLVYDAKGKIFDEVNEPVIRKAREGYYPGIILKNVYDEPGGKGALPPQTVVITLDPVTQRLKQAKFDPKKMNLNDLLASGAAVTVPPAIAGMLGTGKAQAAEPTANVGGETPVSPSDQTVTVDVMGKPIQFPAGMPREQMEQAIREYTARQGAAKSPTPEASTKMLRGAEEFLPKTVPDSTGSGRFSELLGEGFQTAGRGLNQILGQIPSEPVPKGMQEFAGMTPEEAEKPGEKRAYQAVAGAGNIISGLGEALFSPFGLVSPSLERASGLPKEGIETVAGFALPMAWGKLKGLVGGAPASAMAAAKLGPAKGIVQATSDDLFKLRQWITADKADVMQHLQTMPEAHQTAPVQAKFYEKLEDPSVTLTPDEQATFDKYIVPMRKEIQQLLAVSRKMKMPLDDEDWVHRVMKGQEPPTATSHGAADLPQLGTHSLPRKTGVMIPRKFYKMVRESDGDTRIVSQPKDGLLTIWDKGKGNVVNWNEELKHGNTYIIGGQKYRVGTAKTSELEAETPYRYQKSAAVNMGDALVKMRGVVRNIQYLDSLVKTPEWQKWATRGHAPADWRTPKLPQLKDWKVHPKIANALDDFWKPGFDAGDAFDKMRRANRFMIGTMFWNPIPHVENVMGHWFVGRGWDWLRPSGYYSLFHDGAKAIRSVTTLNDDYKSFLKHGGGLIYGGVQNADFYGQMAKKFGLEMQRNQPFWDTFFKTVGMKPPPNPVAWWYKHMNRVLWAANDVFMMQRYFELEAKGMNRLKAIEEAEKHIPNYRIPPEVLGSRGFSQAMQDPGVTAFGRYHYGVWNSYAHMLRDAFGKGKTLEERAEAAGNMVALAALTYGIYPAVSWGLQQLTGDKNIQKIPRGPAAIPNYIAKASRSEQTFLQAIAQSITMAPAPKEIVEELNNRDLYTGRHIVEPGERSKKRQVEQAVEHIARTMITPYNQAEQIANLEAKGVPRQILDAVLGMQDKTARQRRGEVIGKKIERKQAQKRRQRPRGWIEQYGGMME